jgi:hypothetical protein
MMGRHLESFCALEARLANMPLVGTAPRVDVWFLLEYPHPWGNKALEESHVPEPVKQYLSAQVDATPNARIQLIKHRSRKVSAEIVFSIVLSREENPVRYTFALPQYEALLDLDLAAVVSGSPNYDSHISSEPLYLVCTNGRRDPCCASRGLPIYEKLFQQLGSSVWQTTHVGGHRFAANLICLPHGIYYGRLDDIDPLAPIREYEQKRLFADALRGHCCYEPVVQAAERFFHTQVKGLELDRYRLNDAKETASNEWVICFEEPDGALHYLTVGIETTTHEALVSCGSDQKEPVILYHLKTYSVSPQSS